MSADLLVHQKSLAPVWTPNPLMDPNVKRYRGWFGMCDYGTTAPDSHSACYCALKRGHDGPHRAERD